jgi:hypothetical protein
MESSPVMVVVGDNFPLSLLCTLNPGNFLDGPWRDRLREREYLAWSGGKSKSTEKDVWKSMGQLSKDLNALRHPSDFYEWSRGKCRSFSNFPFRQVLVLESPEK